jgi:hypothetical protein
VERRICSHSSLSHPKFYGKEADDSCRHRLSIAAGELRICSEAKSESRHPFPLYGVTVASKFFIFVRSHPCKSCVVVRQQQQASWARRWILNPQALILPGLAKPILPVTRFLTGLRHMAFETLDCASDKPRYCLYQVSKTLRSPGMVRISH